MSVGGFEHKHVWACALDHNRCIFCGKRQTTEDWNKEHGFDQEDSDD